MKKVQYFVCFTKLVMNISLSLFSKRKVEESSKNSNYYHDSFFSFFIFVFFFFL